MVTIVKSNIRIYLTSKSLKYYFGFANISTLNPNSSLRIKKKKKVDPIRTDIMVIFMYFVFKNLLFTARFLAAD